MQSVGVYVYMQSVGVYDFLIFLQSMLMTCYAIRYRISEGCLKTFLLQD